MSNQKTKKELKPEQKEAISSSQNILVSANAGSGKTFVMLQRVLHYIVEEKANILDFLLITFTDSASSQMRVKLEKELLKKFNDAQTTASQKEHLRQQIALLPQADISTIHTFCYKLIKKYFYLLNIEASCAVADQDRSEILQEKAMQNTLNQYTQEQDSDFMYLLSAYDNKRNFNTIKEIVLKIYNFLQNQPSRKKFQERIEKVYSESLESSDICSIIDCRIVSEMDYWKEEFEKICHSAKEAGFEKLELACWDIVNKLSSVKEENGFAKNHTLLFDYLIGFPDKPRKGKNEEWNVVSEKYATRKTDLGKDLERIRKKVYLSKNIEELQENLFWCKNNVDMLMQIEEKFAENYQQLKRQRSLLDFSDLEHLALKLLEDQTAREEISRSYKQIFVDEYQDVNDIQEEIINRIWREGDNLLFLVGDPKQSIYRFRNTNPKIMLDKVTRFTQSSEDKKAITLTHNFRSDKNILDFVNWVFSKIMTPLTAKIDYKKSGMFQAGIDFPEQASSLPSVEINLVAVENIKKEKQIPSSVYSVKQAENKPGEEGSYAKSEAFIVASRIAELVDGKHMIFDTDYPLNGGLRPVNFEDIVILHRSRGAYLDALTSELERQNIPVRNISKEKVLDEYEVQVLFNYLKLLHNAQEDFALVGFLSSDIIRCSFSELAELREKGDEDFHLLCEQYKDEFPKIAKAYDLINRGRQKLINGTIYQVLRWLIQESDYYSLVLAMPNGSARLTNVKVYLNDFLSREYNGDLVSYLSYVENNDEVKNSTQSSGEGSAVSVVTMHQSKGLEYPIVFVVDMAHQFNRGNLSGPCLFSPNLGIGVQVFDKDERYRNSTIARSAIIIEEGEQEFAEQLRVLYVGLTRAKNHLFITGKADLDKIENNISTYSLQRQKDYLSIILSGLESDQLEQLKTKGHITIKTSPNTKFNVNIFPKIEPQTNIEQKVKKEDITHLNEGDSEQILKNIALIEQQVAVQKKNSSIAFKNSVTRIMQEEEYQTQYAFAPKTFNFKEHSVNADEIGNAYHQAMEKIPLDLDTQQEIAQFLQENLDSDTLKLLDCGKIFKCVKYLQQWSKKAQTIFRERRFYLFLPHNQVVPNSAVTDRILIQGVVDFVLCSGDETILIDFKTTREPDDERLREKYKIQMECYKIAVENALKRKVTSKIIYSFFKDCAILFDK